MLVSLTLFCFTVDLTSASKPTNYGFTNEALDTRELSPDNSSSKLKQEQLVVEQLDHVIRQSHRNSESHSSTRVGKQNGKLPQTNRLLNFPQNSQSNQQQRHGVM